MDKNGHVKKVYTRGSSGCEKLDQSLIEAARNASPYGKVPWALKKEAKKRGLVIAFEFGSKPSTNSNEVGR